MSTIDIDHPETWPQDVLAWTKEYVGGLDSPAVPIPDLNGGLTEREGELRSLLGSQKLVAYHCSRLLDHEIAWIRERGLVRLTRALVEQRIGAAHEAGFLTIADRDSLLAGNCFAIGNDEHRQGQVCLVLGRSTFDAAAGGVDPLLGTWGGEGIHGWPLPGRDANVRTFGRPTIVVARIAMSGGRDRVWTAPNVAKLLVGRILELPDLYADVFLFDDVPAEDILAVWQPGDAEYDRHPALPAS